MVDCNCAILVLLIDCLQLLLGRLGEAARGIGSSIGIGSGSNSGHSLPVLAARMGSFGDCRLVKVVVTLTLRRTRSFTTGHDLLTLLCRIGWAVRGIGSSIGSRRSGRRRRRRRRGRQSCAPELVPFGVHLTIGITLSSIAGDDLFGVLQRHFDRLGY